jgi:hypothetical protein
MSEPPKGWHKTAQGVALGLRRAVSPSGAPQGRHRRPQGLEITSRAPNDLTMLDKRKGKAYLPIALFRWSNRLGKVLCRKEHRELHPEGFRMAHHLVIRYYYSPLTFIRLARGVPFTTIPSLYLFFRVRPSRANRISYHRRHDTQHIPFAT